MDFQKEIGRNLSAIVRMTHSHLNIELEQMGMSSGQFPFFMALIKHEGITQEELTEMLCMDKATTARAVQKLIKFGMIKKFKCDSDHRCQRLFMTEKGKKLVPEIMKILRSWSELMFEGFTIDEREKFGEQLSKVFNNIKNIRGETT